jgi:folate-binding protein YgfZ
MNMRAGYGDVVSEYRALTSSAALVQRAHDILWVEGPGAVGFLQGILSQDLEAMSTGSVARSFFLAPQGKLQALMWIARGSDKVAIVVDAGHGERVAGELDYYRIRVKAEIRPEERDVWEVWGPEAAAVTGLTNEDGWEETDDGVLIPIPMAGLPRVVVIGAQPASGLAMAGAVATAAVRVERLEPVYGIDVDEKTIPQETGLTDEAVSFTKGCYLGQELVARIDSRGHVNRVLRRLAITRNILPPEGAGVFVDDKQVGTVSSVSENLVSPIGLSMLRREVEVGTEVSVRWADQAVPAIVGGPAS